MSNLRWKIAQWTERRWWRQYLKDKSADEYLQWKKKYWEDFLQKIDCDQKLINTQSCIDLGCGPAGIFLLFEHATAVDPLLDYYNHDLAHFSIKNYPHNQFITTSIEDFNPSSTYDTIFCINAINHVSDMDQGIAKLGECAHANSTLVISIDAHNHTFLKHMFQLVPGDVLHPHQFNLWEYQQKIEAAGWRIERIICLDKGFIFNYYVIVATKA